MSEKSLTKSIITSYSSVISICKLLKPHATNIMLLPNNKILMQPSIQGIRNYMIANSDIDYDPFLYTYLPLADISKVNTKFRKTKSEISWENNKGQEYLIITANDDENTIGKCPIFSNQEVLNSLFTVTYHDTPTDNELTIENLLVDEDSSNYIDLGKNFIDDMFNKKLCEIDVDGQNVIISRPFLGDMKKTEWLGYRVVEVNEYRTVLKFKQVEKLGNIYTYAGFLNY